MKDTQDWESFWKDRFKEQAIPSEEKYTWYNMVWRVNLEDWYQLFRTLSPGQEMLECGCGSAKVSVKMAKHGFKCTMLDYSEEAIKLAFENFEVLSLSGRFICGDVNHLPFDDDSFDIVFSGGMLEYFTDIETPIKEMVRVLKPGGLFAANMVPDKFSIQTIADLWRTFAHSMKNLIRGNYGQVLKRVYSVPPSYGVKFTKLEEYEATMIKLGLTRTVSLCTLPFPNLGLPGFAEAFYYRTMRSLIPQWRKFNQSKNFLTKIFGITYTVYGLKE